MELPLNQIKKSNRPLLSFAIPTYNFGGFIGKTIKSIQEGVETLSASQFEIVVLDGGSKDETDDVMAALMSQYLNIRYIKNNKRGGIDSDMNTVAEATGGKYIWLFSADDLLTFGWDRYITPLLMQDGDVYLVPAILCDVNMSPLRTNPIIRDCNKKGPLRFDIGKDNSSLDRYLNRIASLEAMFSFMSAIVVNGKIWRSLPVREDYFGSCWAHCARMMPLFFRTTNITYINNFLIMKRGGNDSFMEQGFINRIGIAVEGWDRIIDEFFKLARHRMVLYDALRKDMPILLFIYAKITSKNRCETNRLSNMLKKLYGEIDLPFSTKLLYKIYRLVPANLKLNKLIKYLLPSVIRLRHKLRSVFS